MFESIGVAELPTGPGLAEGLDGLALADLSAESLFDVLKACERLAAWAQARQLTAINEIMRRETSAGSPGAASRPGEGAPGEFAVMEIACALKLSDLSASVRVDLARNLEDRLPFVLDSLEAGTIDLARARVLVEETSGLSAQDAQAVAAGLLSAASRLTSAQLRYRVRRRVAVVDSEAASRRAAGNRRARRAWLGELEDGLAELGALLPANDAALGWSVLDTLARTVLAEDPEDRRTLDEVRADVFADLVTGRAHVPAARVPAAAAPAPPSASPTPAPPTPAPPTPAPPTPCLSSGRRRLPPPAVLQVTVPWRTLVGGSNLPGEVSGFGPVDAETARAVAVTALEDLSGGLSVHWIVHDDSGRAVATTSTTRHRRRLDEYRARVLTALGVEVRDRTCRHPGCRAPARRCDHDHTVPFPFGRTVTCNLACLCRRHHRSKTHGRWRVEQLPGGRLVWTSPTGTVHRTDPGLWAEPVGPPAPGEADDADAEVPDPGRSPEREREWVDRVLAEAAAFESSGGAESSGPGMPASPWTGHLEAWDDVDRGYDDRGDVERGYTAYSEDGVLGCTA
jgi:hypothetical protein